MVCDIARLPRAGTGLTAGVLAGLGRDIWHRFEAVARPTMSLAGVGTCLTLCCRTVPGLAGLAGTAGLFFFLLHHPSDHNALPGMNVEELQRGCRREVMSCMVQGCSDC